MLVTLKLSVSDIFGLFESKSNIDFCDVRSKFPVK